MGVAFCLFQNRGMMFFFALGMKKPFDNEAHHLPQ
jgi:hypothetical protein